MRFAGPSTEWKYGVPYSKNNKFKMVPTEDYGQHRAPLCPGPCVSAQTEVPDQGAWREQQHLRMSPGPLSPVPRSCFLCEAPAHWWLADWEVLMWSQTHSVLISAQCRIQILLQSPPLFLLPNELSSVAVDWFKPPLSHLSCHTLLVFLYHSVGQCPSLSCTDSRVLMWFGGFRAYT